MREWQVLVKRALLLLALVAGCSGPPSVEDAGVDAGANIDAGAHDAGEPDAGEPDAGSSIDAGEPDAGEPDAGEADAGEPDAGEPDAGEPDAGEPDAGEPDAGNSDGGHYDGQLVAVSHQRELRGLWVSTVFNLDVPLAAARSPDAGPVELQAIVDVAADHGFNALFFQVRPESDAWYQSTREPWSRFVSGTQGQSPGWDPLATMVQLAHARGLEVHAWLNPFRGLTSPTVAASPLHITQVLSQHAITYNGAVTMDPSAPAVRTWIAEVCGEITTNYDVDGIHFDDYLYPYPAATPFPDDVQYAGYTADGGTMTKSDWRRANINALMQETSAAVTNAKPWVRFGVSPFGIYRPGQPPGINGLDSYEAISSDPLAWMNAGWVDYVAPQLYWPSTQVGQQFGLLIDWWAGRAQSAGRQIFAGHALYRVTMPGWSIQELKTQVLLTRAEYPHAAGGIWFRTQMLRDDIGPGSKALFANDVYAAPALPPTLAVRRTATFTPPLVQRTGSMLTLTHPSPASVRGYALYRLNGAQLVFTRFVPGQSATPTVASGTWAVAAVDRSDVESPGVIALVP
ncbi:MAG: family 10 glycosylhydrolase [Myxococcaceae bacterium]|nr:family 10 glycosylhydrolase [Myxococcaceae bacterium]